MAEAFPPKATNLRAVVCHIAVSSLAPVAAALVAWLMVFAIHAGFGLWLSRAPSHRLAILFDAGTTATVIAVMTWASLVAFHRLRRQHESEAAEVNHNVRNALQLIVNAEYRAQGTVRRSLILESVARIDSTLRKLFPPSQS